MIAISAAEAFGPAMDAARSPERRVKVKLTTRTVRHTKAASNSLRNIKKCIVDNYNSERVTARRCRTIVMATSEFACLFCICSHYAQGHSSDRRSHSALGFSFGPWILPDSSLD